MLLLRGAATNQVRGVALIESFVRGIAQMPFFAE
jgi:hypothetical protein